MVFLAAVAALVLGGALFYLWLLGWPRPKIGKPIWPPEGTRFRSNVDIEVGALTTWAAPFTGGDNRILPAGEEFTVMFTPHEGSTAVCCMPVRYDELHSRFVNSVDRADSRYGGYYLTVTIERLRTNCMMLYDPSATA